MALTRRLYRSSRAGRGDEFAVFHSGCDRLRAHTFQVDGAAALIQQIRTLQRGTRAALKFARTLAKADDGLMTLWWLVLSVLTMGDGGDAGLDGGLPAEPAQHWQWTHADGGWLNDAGLTDVVTMRVGETAVVQFPLPIVLMQCDEPLLTLSATQDTLLLEAVKAGHTTCGFWYRPQSWPHRTLEVTVAK